MKTKSSAPATKTHSSKAHGLLAVALLAIILIVLFWRSFLPGYVHFANDGPLGQQNSAWQALPSGLMGMWADLNYLGDRAGTFTLSLTMLLHLSLSPIIFAKVYPIVALFILGLGAWTCFWQLRLSPLAATLGAFAAMLNSTFFSTACWGIASQEIAVGMDFAALALIVGCSPSLPTHLRWTRFVLAGLCIGINVVEAADIGAIFSMLLALFILVHAWLGTEGSALGRTIQGVGRIIVVAVFALFIGIQAVLALIGTSIHGIAGTAQDTQTKAAQWDWATQWSLPKVETLGLAVPGLFGYKLDTPKDMMPFLQNAYRGGAYWGGVGRAPELDRYFDSGSQGPQPSAPGLFMRFTGGGNYCGILVLLVAGWAIAQALRRQNSVFPDAQKRMICFWAVVMLFCLLFAWGRFAPFYAVLYQLPYFSTIRNPAKFIIFFSYALVIVFAYGIHALDRRYLDASAVKAPGLVSQFKNWWARAGGFDRRWTFASVGLVAAAVLGTLIYAGQQPALASLLQKVGFPGTDPTDETSSVAIAAFSLHQLWWFLLFFVVASGLLLAIVSGFFGGPRTKVGAVLLGLFMVVDLGRADLPWIIHWDYKQKYEIGSLNPILQFLDDKPYEHRVAELPFRTPPGYELLDELYRIEWTQHHFPYYNIQTLDIVQMPRMPEDMKAFKEAVGPTITREWQLTNTRYLLGPAGFLDVMNQQLDPVEHRFHIVKQFEVVAKPGISNPTRLEELTAVPNDNGRYALFDFTGALPRAKVYTTWQVNTNDAANLKTLCQANFDPEKTVLVSTPAPGLPAAATNNESGSVDFQSYAPKRIVLSAQTTAPSVLLLNDKFDPNWSVTVDGKSASLLRCNYIMRGVYLPTAGAHTVEFQFSLPHQPFYVSLAAAIIGLGLCGILFVGSRRVATAAA